MPAYLDKIKKEISDEYEYIRSMQEAEADDVRPHQPPGVPRLAPDAPTALSPQTPSGMRKLEEAREQNAGKQGHEKKELRKKVMAKKRLKNARARHHEAARVHNAEQEEVHQYNHARGAAEHTEEDESAGAGSLSQLFRNGIEFENRLRYGMLAPSDGKTCAASCNQQDQFRSHLYYVYQSRAGLSDRAWHIAHAQAVANSLCARLGLRPPYQVLASLHNHGADVKPEWRWSRYFDWGDIAAPLRLDNDSLGRATNGTAMVTVLHMCPAPPS